MRWTFVQTAGQDNVVAGASFHCYAGDVSAQSTFHSADPVDEVYFSESFLFFSVRSLVDYATDTV